MPSLLVVDSPRSYRRIQVEKKKFMAKGATTSWLSDQLSKGTFMLLLDCRPYAEFARCHVQGAINLTIPSLMLRRLKKGTNFAISSLITSEEGKAQFNRNLHLASGVVLYDSETSEVSNVCSSSALGVLLKKFSEDVNVPVWLLEGKSQICIFLFKHNASHFIQFTNALTKFGQSTCSFADFKESSSTAPRSIRILFVF